MSFSHFTAIVRMRWQMTLNKFHKSSKANQIALTVLLVLAALGSFSAFVFTVAGGSFFLAKMEPFYVIYVWDVLAVAFLFGWAMGLMVELQRSEMLSLKNLLHLPISLSGAFFLNYASSFASLTMLMFLPVMFGLSLASVLYFGSKSLVVFALLASFLWMVTAVTYQLRGWLARLMENKRTRGTVIVITTILFVMIFQIPNLINMRSMEPRNAAARERTREHHERLADLEKQHTAGEIDMKTYNAAVESAQEEFALRKKTIREAQTSAFNHTATVVNASLPIGWLPYGASAAARGAVATPWLCVLGMSTIGCVSLALAYRSTLRAYTGYHNKEYRPGVSKRERVLAKDSMLEKSVPFLNETQSVIAMATLRSTFRAPEAKMALLTPLIFACVFGSMFLTRDMGELSDFARPWFGIGALGISLFGMVQMMLNMFGLDRQGFRAYVLMPASRRDILLGKNMGILPFAATLGALLIVFTGIAGKMQFTHVVGSLLQIAIAFLIYFIFSNYASIVAPLGLAVGTMKPVSMKFSVLLVQIAAMLLIPVAVLPAALALATEQLASKFGGIHGVPIYLLLTLIELPLALWFYRKLLTHEGRLLQQHEQAILEVISNVAD